MNDIYRDGVSYSVSAILGNHCCEVECLLDGQRGGWIVRCTTNDDQMKVREFHDKAGLGEAMTKAAKYFLKHAE